VARRVEARDLAEAVRLGREDAGAELVLPEDGEGAALRVVVEAHHKTRATSMRRSRGSSASTLRSEGRRAAEPACGSAWGASSRA
jgi:hypothetical protein